MQIDSTAAAARLAAQHPAPGAGVAPSRQAAGAAPAAPADAPQGPSLPRGDGASARPVHKGLRHWSPQYHQNLAGAQLSQNYLGDLTGRLRALQVSLSDRLAEQQRGAQNSAPALAAQLRSFSQRWDARASATLGSLDADLAYSGPGQTRQSFRIPGLDARALQGKGRETLFFSVGGTGRVPVPVPLEPGESLGAQVQRLDFALASSGIRAALDAQGELSFSVAEAQWPRVRDSLAIQGAGQRYPSGQMHLARPQARESAVRPENWSAADADATRQALRETHTAQVRVREAQRQVQSALSDAARTLAAQETPAQAPQWAVLFSQEFQAQAARVGFQQATAIIPAMAGISRERVVSLLRLPSL